MFIYSCKAGTLKLVGVICLSLVALITLMAFVPAYAGNRHDTPTEGVVADAPGNQVGTEVSYRYDKVKSSDDAAGFLHQFGWRADAGSVESADVTIPAEFDKIFAGYNEMQKSQGLDLSKYRKKTVQRYTFHVTNYETGDGTPYEGDVYANVLVYRGRVIGGDICSADVNGFIHGFEKPAVR